MRLPRRPRARHESNRLSSTVVLQPLGFRGRLPLDTKAPCAPKHPLGWGPAAPRASIPSSTHPPPTSASTPKARIPDGLELVLVPMAINEADEDLKDKEADLCVFHQSCREEPVQEGAGQSRQHVAALESSRDLQVPGRKRTALLPNGSGLSNGRHLRATPREKAFLVASKPPWRD